MTAKVISRYHSNFLVLLLCMVIFITNISQMPVFSDEGITQYLSMPVWIILFIYCLCTRRLPHLNAFGLMWPTVVLFMIVFMITISIDEAYLRSSLPIVLGIAMFITICGSACARGLTERDMSKIFTSYILSVLILGIDVYNGYLTGNSFSDLSYGYLYDEKNSASQILMSAWVLILFTKMRSSPIVRIIYIAIMLFMTYEILMLQSRATIIGFPIALIIALQASKGKQGRNMRLISCIFLFAIAIAVMNEYVWEILRDKIIYGGRIAGNIDSLSSGRAEEWMRFPDLFESHPFLGYGRLKNESFILTSLLEFGIIGGIPLIIIALCPLGFALHTYRRYRNNSIFQMFTVIAIVYTLNGIFEQLAPFGPGAKCYFLWFIFGILATQYHIAKLHHAVQ